MSTPMRLTVGKRSPRGGKRRGFTMIELMVAMAITGVAALVPGDTFVASLDGVVELGGRITG